MAQQPGADPAHLQRVRSWIADGVTLDLISTPECVDHENTFSVSQEEGAVRLRIEEYIAFGAIALLSDDHPLPFGVQPLHVIIKEGKKPRLVIDLSRNLNDNLAYEYFSYSSVRDAVEMASPLCWFSKLDLSNCFLSFPLHPSAWPHFIFRFDGRLHQFTHLPFGLSSAPRICTELLSVVAFRLSLEATERNLRFLDDILLITQDEQSGHAVLCTAQRIIDEFGLVVNTAKTEGPAQQLAFLGILLDSRAQTLSCTAERLVELRSLLDGAMASTKIRLPALMSLIGKLQFAAQVLPGARPFTRRLIDLCTRRTSALDRQATRSTDGAATLRRRHFAAQRASVRTDRGFRADIRFWQKHLLRWDGTQRWRSAQSAPFVFATDASLAGFGFYLESAPTASVQWLRSNPSSPASVQESTTPTASVQWASSSSLASVQASMMPPAASVQRSSPSSPASVQVSMMPPTASVQWATLSPLSVQGLSPLRAASVQRLSPSSAASVQPSTSPSTAFYQWPSHLRVGSGFSGTWSQTDAHLHSTSGQMTWCELFAVYAALFTYRTVLRHCCALFWLDNSIRRTRTEQAGHQIPTTGWAPPRDLHDRSGEQHLALRPPPSGRRQRPRGLPLTARAAWEHRHRRRMGSGSSLHVFSPLCRIPCAQSAVRQRARQAVIDFFQGYILTTNTVRSYKSQYAAFLRICTMYGIDYGQCLSEADLCFVMAVYANSHKITSLPTFISALNRYHRELFQVELPRTALYQQTRVGIENYYGNTAASAAKTALTLDDLCEFARHLDTRYFEHARDWCACLLAFFGLLRINEYMTSGLRHGQVRLTSYGVDITVVSSKTSKIPVVVSLTSRNDQLCPARALSHYLGFLRILSLPSRPDDPLFVSRLQNQAVVTATTDSEFIARLRELITTAFPDRDPSRYAGHSFRRGGASALQLAGVPAAVIQKHGRWTSDAFRAYLDATSNPALRLIATRALLRPAP